MTKRMAAYIAHLLKDAEGRAYIRGNTEDEVVELLVSLRNSYELDPPEIPRSFKISGIKTKGQK